MERFQQARETFEHAIQRARQMVSLFDALSAIRAEDPANDDALRAAYIQAVSSFDFFMHEIARIETHHRFCNRIPTRNLLLPMEVTAIENEEERLTAAGEAFRSQNAHKSFVDPGNVAQLLSCFCADPWDKIAERFNDGKVEGDQITSAGLKAQIKEIWKRRNKIAHEADINPAMAGIFLWPIDKADTLMSIEFIFELGKAIPETAATPLQCV